MNATPEDKFHFLSSTSSSPSPWFDFPCCLKTTFCARTENDGKRQICITHLQQDLRATTPLDWNGFNFQEMVIPAQIYKRFVGCNEMEPSKGVFFSILCLANSQSSVIQDTCQISREFKTLFTPTAVWLHWFQAFLKARQQAQNYNREIGLYTNSNFKLLYLWEGKIPYPPYFAQSFNRHVDKNGKK